MKGICNSTAIFWLITMAQMRSVSYKHTMSLNTVSRRWLKANWQECRASLKAKKIIQAQTQIQVHPEPAPWGQVRRIASVAWARSRGVRSSPGSSSSRVCSRFKVSRDRVSSRIRTWLLMSGATSAFRHRWAKVSLLWRCMNTWN